MATDSDIAKDLMVGMLNSSAIGSNQNVKAEVDKQRKRFYPFYKTSADAMASTASAETTMPWNRLLSAGRVTAIRVHSTAALTGDPTNNAVLTVSKRDAAGANKTTVAVLTTTASWVAGTSVSFVLTDANVAVVEGGSLTFEIAKGGSGIIVPIATVIAEVVDG